jgi:hypothetical protein
VVDRGTSFFCIKVSNACRARCTSAAISRSYCSIDALQQLLADIRARRINVIVVYKVDRLTRSLADFAIARRHAVCGGSWQCWIA